MKYAVYFSGRIQTYECLLPYLKKVKDKYNVDYFCSLNIDEMDEYHLNFIQELGIQHYFFQEHNEVYQKDWFERFRRLSCDNEHVWYKISSSFYNNKKAFELIDKCQEQNK